MRALRLLLTLAGGMTACASLPAQPLPEQVSRPPAMKTETSAALALESLEQETLARHPALRQAAAQVQAARGRRVQAGLYPNPTVGYASNEMGNEGRGGQQGGFIGQEFVTANKLGLSRGVASAEVREAEQLYALARQRVLNDLRVAFYEALVAQRQLDLAGQLQSLGEEGLKASEALFEAQEVSRVDTLQARIELDTSRIMLSNARHRHQAAWRKLAATAGLTGLEATELVGDPAAHLPRLNWEESLAMVLSASPEASAAQARIARARRALDRAAVEPIPNVTVQATVQHDLSTRDDVASLQVGVPWPLYDRNQGAIQAARADLSAARHEAERIQLELQARLAETFERYDNARQQAATYQESILPSARDSLRLVTLGYRQGEFNYITLLTAQRTLFQANMDYLSALVDYRRTAVAIEGLLVGEASEGSARQARN